jgi:hypothetical protein
MMHDSSDSTFNRSLADLSSAAVNSGEGSIDAETAIKRAQASLEAVQARLSEAEATARVKRRLRAEAADALIELEASLSEVRAHEAAARERREQVEQGMGGYRAVQAFAAAARADAERMGEHDRALQEKTVEERAAYEASVFLSRLTKERDEENRWRAERGELERRIVAERQKEATCAEEGDAAETLARMMRGEVALAENDVDRTLAAHAPTDAPAEIAEDPTDAREGLDAEHVLAMLVEPPRAAEPVPVIEERAAKIPELPQPARRPVMQPAMQRVMEPAMQPARPSADSADVAETIVAMAGTILGLFAFGRPKK